MNQNTVTRLLAAVACTFAAAGYAAPPTPVPAPAPPQNVFVTNPATNPVKTTEAFPRTPVAIEARPESPYTVPADFRLVIETLVATVSCSPPATLASATLFVNTDNLHDLLAFPLQLLKSSAILTVHGGTLSARIVLEPGTNVFIRKECDDGRAGSSGAGDSTRIFGYLISVRSPSLAP